MLPCVAVALAAISLLLRHSAVPIHLAGPPQPSVAPPVVVAAPRPGDGTAPIAAAEASPVEAPMPIAVAPVPATLADATPLTPTTADLGWREKPSPVELPTLRIISTYYDSCRLEVTRGEFRREWTWTGDGSFVNDTVPPGEYDFAIFGPRAVREPDIAGKLRCRKYRLYEFEVSERPWWAPRGTQWVDWGDSR